MYVRTNVVYNLLEKTFNQIHVTYGWRVQTPKLNQTETRGRARPIYDLLKGYVSEEGDG